MLWPNYRPRLFAFGGLKLHHQFSGYPAAVLHLDALGLRPIADLGGVVCGDGRPPAETLLPAFGSSPAGCRVPVERLAECIGVLVVEVYLVVRAVKREPDCTFGLTAIDVIDEQRLDFLGHCSPLTTQMNWPNSV
jgi:hypothetical protein